MRKGLRLLVLPLLVAVIAGCSKPPEMEMANADQAASAAQSAQAAKYAPSDWKMAQDTLNAAKTEKAGQDGRFALFRSYGKAKALYEKASALSNTATTNAKAEMERVRKETEAILAAVKTDLDSTTAMVMAAPVGKDTKADIELMKQDVTALGSLLAQAQSAWSRNDFDAAKSQAQQVRDRMTTIKTQLEAAIAKRGAKGKKH